MFLKDINDKYINIDHVISIYVNSNNEIKKYNIVYEILERYNSLKEANERLDELIDIINGKDIVYINNDNLEFDYKSKAVVNKKK